MAMARPRRPAREADLVDEAAGMIVAELGVRPISAIARVLAESVVREAIAELESEADPFASALAAVARQFEASPITELATSPQVDTATEITSRRVQRFQARGCTQLSSAAWTAETAALAAEVAGVLTRRYARHLRAQK